LSSPRKVEVVIVGAGQSGLATAYFLKRHGVETLLLDRNELPGGAWLQAWDSLRLFSPGQFSSLPGWGLFSGNVYPTRSELIAYPGAYESRYGFDVIRPSTVVSVLRNKSLFEIQSSDGELFQCRALVSAGGTWGSPVIPRYPKSDLFEGSQIHSAHYQRPDCFAGKNVLIVGGGNSGAQILAEISRVANTTWVTLTPPTFLPDDVDGRVLFERATLRWKAQMEGKPVTDLPGGFADVVAVDSVKEARDRGVLQAREPFVEFTRRGVIWPDGQEQHFDVVVWCTGFKADLAHLRGLDIHDSSGKVDTTQTRSNRVPGLWFVGYGDWCGFASATLIGVQRHARSAALDIFDYLKQAV
jgi:putative flavoprotein involved in K+ transport